jgi:hypothetical protein
VASSSILNKTHVNLVIFKLSSLHFSTVTNITWLI